MFDFKSLTRLASAAALAVVATAGAVAAAPITGVFTFETVTFDAGGITVGPPSSNEPGFSNSAATIENFNSENTSAAAAAKNSFTYTGALDFETTGSATKISDFIGSGAGSITIGSIANDLVMTSGNFTTTTLFKITGSTIGGASGTIFHDDGITLYDGTGDAVTDASAANPTVVTEFGTAYAFTTDAFTLVYSAANGNPEALQMNVIPLPAPFLLLMGGIAGLGFVSRKRTAACRFGAAPGRRGPDDTFRSPHDRGPVLDAARLLER